MDILYAPWRQSYVAKGGSGSSGSVSSENVCPFCLELRKQSDQELFLVKRYTYSFVLMNLYPYNAGHLLVIPYRHISSLSDLNEDERNELFEVATHATAVVTKVLNAHGANLGINLGKAAGAGVPEHLHLHIVPRWVGDTNFLPVIGRTKQISVELSALYERLKEAF